MSNKKRIVRLFIAAFIFALISASLVWQTVQADNISVNRPGFIKLSGDILKENGPLSYSEAHALEYANQYRYHANAAKGDIVYSDDLALWYAQQYGNWNPDDTRLATNSREIPEVVEYAHPLTVEFARQHGYWDPDDTRSVLERREIPEYSDALALWYANQNGRFSSESSDIDYAHPPLTVVYARQHGYGDPNDTRSVSERREIPEYSDALALWYANQNGRLSSESSEVIEYAHPLTVEFARQHGYWDPDDTRAVSERREMPEYSNALELWYANQNGRLSSESSEVIEYAHPLTVEYARQHGYWDPDDTRAVSERREMPEYSNALELWYAQQYGNWNPDEIVKRETE